ncbi:putative fatty acid elongase [Thermoascus aurantiacus ATCC 26904]
MLDSLRVRTAGPAIELALPPASLFSFPPRPRPDPIPAPPTSEPSWHQPFNIPPELYTRLLDVKVPVTIAGVYAATVMILNRVNQDRGYRPWAFSQTRLFKVLVVLHNVFLAVYSAWTFAGMVRAFRSAWPERDDPHGIVAIADSLCHINGPRGYGNAAVFNETADRWDIYNPEFQLAEGGVPAPTDAGRLWNQGLAYYGWIFYLSKFYEVLDTAIILAKGKKSSTLQTYHHAGAMMCMWAGIRYVASPIWIFALVNSGIHALMYTYYALTAISVRVPTVVKRTLTTMQITQFVIGTALAAIHLFVRYTVPVLVPYEAPTPAPAVPSAAESGIAATSTPGASLAPWLKRLALRAAGVGGIAENVLDTQGQQFHVEDAVPAPQLAQPSVPEHVLEYRTIQCVDTTGQAFAIWLNVMYLLPLTYLFVRFFIRSYLHRKTPSVRHPMDMHIAEKAGLDALKDVSREIQRAVIEMHGDGEDEDEARAQADGSVEREATQQKVDEDVATATGSQIAADEDGFSAVPPKHRAKKTEVESAPGTPEARDANPFEVLETGNDS